MQQSKVYITEVANGVMVSSVPLNHPDFEKYSREIRMLDLFGGVYERPVDAKQILKNILNHAGCIVLDA